MSEYYNVELTVSFIFLPLKISYFSLVKKFKIRFKKSQLMFVKKKSQLMFCMIAITFCLVDSKLAEIYNCFCNLTFDM
jgi:hypothetical protein